MNIDLHDLIFKTTYVGYGLGVILIIIGIAALVGALTGRDDGEFRSIGRPIPSPPRQSPFAAKNETEARRDATTAPHPTRGSRRG